MSAARFNIAAFALAASCIGAALAGNIAIDPAWMFTLDHRFNTRQIGYDERQQKQNYLAARRPRIDTLVLGSSRVTFIDQREFEGNAYNFAVSAMLPSEYAGYVAYAEEILGAAPQTIIVGVDFFGVLRPKETGSTPSAASWWQKARSLLSFDLIETAARNAIASLRDDRYQTYDRDNRRYYARQPKPQWQQEFSSELRKFVDVIYREDQPDWQGFRTSLAELRERAPRSRFVVFTTPISEPQFRGMICAGRLPVYRRWLTELVGIFAEVHHFMDLNTVTRELSHFADSHHLYPEAGRWVAHKVVGFADPSVPADFGVRLDESNIETYLQKTEDAAGATDCAALQREWGLAPFPPRG